MAFRRSSGNAPVDSRNVFLGETRIRSQGAQLVLAFRTRQGVFQPRHTSGPLSGKWSVSVTRRFGDARPAYGEPGSLPRRRLFNFRPVTRRFALVFLALKIYFASGDWHNLRNLHRVLAARLIFSLMFLVVAWFQTVAVTRNRSQRQNSLRRGSRSSSYSQKNL